MINSAHSTLSCIDVTFTSPGIAANCNWRVLNDTWGSDHCPIKIEINLSVYRNPSKKPIGINSKRHVMNISLNLKILKILMTHMIIF